MTIPSMTNALGVVSHAIVLVFKSDKNLANNADNVLGILFQPESPDEDIHALLVDPRFDVEDVVDYLRSEGATIPDFWAPPQV